MPSQRETEAIAVERACLARSSASVSTGTPIVAAEGFVTDCQPSVGVPIVVIDPAGAAMSPASSAVAVTVICPIVWMTTDAGSSQRFSKLSMATPFVMTVPA